MYAIRSYYVPNDNSLSFTSNNSGNVLVGKNYTTYVTLKSNYNRTLTGKLYVGDHYNDDNTYVITSYSIHYTKLYERVISSSVAGLRPFLAFFSFSYNFV